MSLKDIYRITISRIRFQKWTPDCPTVSAAVEAGLYSELSDDAFSVGCKTDGKDSYLYSHIILMDNLANAVLNCTGTFAVLRDFAGKL